MHAHGGTLFDTAPSYGSSEEVAGRLAGELGLTDQLFWATKLNVAGRDGDDLLLRNFEGGVFRYPAAGGTLGRNGQP